MNDPAKAQLGRIGGELFDAVCRTCNGASLEQVYNVAGNLLVNAIRMSTGERKDAEAKIDEVFARAKDVLLCCYDPVTGKRRSVYPFTQVAQAPFFENESKIFPPGG